MPQTKNQGNVVSFSQGSDDDPGDKLRQYASDYDDGEIQGVITVCVMKDGSVRYKLMGALADEENLLDAVSIVDELKRRIMQSLIFSQK